MPSVHTARSTHRPRLAGLRVFAVAACASVAACSGRNAAGNANGTGTTASANPATLATCCGDSAMGVALRIANDYRESAFTTDHPERGAFWDQVLPMAGYARMASSVVGTVNGTDTLRTLVWGGGPDTVLVWSEGGDRLPGQDAPVRSVGSLTLADLVRWLANTRAEDRDDAFRARLRSGVTLVLLPMLRSNPDDAAQQRLIRDVVRQWRPSVVLALRDDESPGEAAALDDAPLAAMTIRVLPQLATPATANAADNGASEATRRGTQVAVALLTALRSELPSRLFRAASPPVARTLADAVAGEDVAVVELATGVLPADPAQRRLRAVQVAALLTTLDGIATGAVRSADTALFARQPARPPQAGSSPE